MTTIRAHFDGKVFVPDEPVDLPAGQPLELSVRSVEKKTPLKSFAQMADWIANLPPIENNDSPGDLAAQHDHYLYGTPRNPPESPDSKQP